MRAFDLKRQHWKQRDIADALGVTKAAVSQWVKAADEYGIDGLVSHPHPGPRPKLTEAQLQRVPEFLSHGAEAYGFRGAVWTCARVATVIERELGISYSPSHVSRLLKHLKWTPQKPIERATQRDEALIAQWRTEIWPELKKERNRSGALRFS